MGLCGFGAGLGRTACSAAGTRSDAALRRAGAGLDRARRRRRQWRRSRSWSRGDGHEELALGELDDQLFLLAPAAEGNEGKRGKYLYLPWRNFFAKADTRAMVTRAGSTPVGKALERTHGLSAKIVGYDSNEEYNQATIQVMFKDGGPFSYFLEPPKPENQRRGNENMFLTHPAVYILTGNPCMGLDPEVLRL